MSIIFVSERSFRQIIIFSRRFSRFSYSFSSNKRMYDNFFLSEGPLTSVKFNLTNTQFQRVHQKSNINFNISNCLPKIATQIKPKLTHLLINLFVNLIFFLRLWKWWWLKRDQQIASSDLTLTFSPKWNFQKIKNHR